MRARSPLIIITAIVAAVATAGAADYALRNHAHRATHAHHVPPAAALPPPAAAQVLDVNGAPVPAAFNTTVAQALAAAGIKLTPGHYLSIITQRQLSRSDGRYGRILLDGQPVQLDGAVQAGEDVRVTAAQNLVEPTETVIQHEAPAVQSALYVGGRDAIVRVVRGRFSHEVVSRHVVRPAVVGHLVRPGAVALTFDDGPWPEWTHKILALLASKHVHATFCMIGRQAAKYPKMVREVAAAGHDLCDHTWDHDLDLKVRPPGQIKLDIWRGAHAIVKATKGKDHPLFFRAPGGNWSPRIDREAQREGMTLLPWTVDPRDWSRPGVHAILHTVYAELRPGGVILMHDGGGNRWQTYRALKVLLWRLPRMGYHFVLPPTGQKAA